MRMRLRISTLGKHGHVQVLLYKRPLSVGESGPNLIHGSLDLYDRQTTPNGISIGLVVTSRQIDHAIYLAIGRILYYELRCGSKRKNT